MVWYVRDAECRELLTTEETIPVIEEVFRDDANGEVVSRPTVELALPRGALRVKVGADFAHDAYGFKAYPAGGRYLIVLYDLDSGLDAIVEARYVTELRTGAVSAVATKYMARADATSIGIIGTGREARQQLLSTISSRPFELVRCYSRDAARREAFAEEMHELLSIEVVAEESGEACVEGADVVTTITSARDPVLLGGWLRPGTHINAVGATTPSRRELDEEAVGRCARVVVELKEGAMSEIGELIRAVEGGTLRWEDVAELKDVVSGAVPGRAGDDEITLVDTVGIGAADVALAAYVAKKARSQGVGTDLDFEAPYHVSSRSAR